MVSSYPPPEQHLEPARPREKFWFHPPAPQHLQAIRSSESRTTRSSTLTHTGRFLHKPRLFPLSCINHAHTCDPAWQQRSPLQGIDCRRRQRHTSSSYCLPMGRERRHFSRNITFSFLLAIVLNTVQRSQPQPHHEKGGLRTCKSHSRHCPSLQWIWSRPARRMRNPPRQVSQGTQGSWLPPISGLVHLPPRCGVPPVLVLPELTPSAADPERRTDRDDTCRLDGPACSTRETPRVAGT